MDWNKVFSTLMWKISQGRKKKNIERKSKTSASKQFSCFLYLYHKIFWRTSFWMQATFVVFSSFMGKKLKQGIRNRNILAFSYLYDKNIWKTSGRHSELKQFPWFLWFIPSVLKHHRPPKKRQVYRNQKNISRYSPGNAFIHNFELVSSLVAMSLLVTVTMLLPMEEKWYVNLSFQEKFYKMKDKNIYLSSVFSIYQNSRYFQT